MPTIPMYSIRAAQEYRVSYLPAESDTGMFGGNSNWRGPIWMPVNALLIRALLQYYAYYGDDFTVECPTGSGRQMTLYQVAEEISRRLANIFVRDDSGRRPVFGGTEKFQNDPQLARLRAVLRIFPWRQRRGLGRQSPDGLDGSRRPLDALLRRREAGAGSSAGQGSVCQGFSPAGGRCDGGQTLTFAPGILVNTPKAESSMFDGSDAPAHFVPVRHRADGDPDVAAIMPARSTPLKTVLRHSL